MSNTKNHYSISSLVKLIDNGKLNSSISCRGGFGASYVQFVFVKTAKDKLSVFRSSSFDTSPQEYITSNDKPPMITKSGITFYSDSSKHNRWYLYFLDTFITIGDFDSNGCKLLPIKTPWKIDARYIQCTNGDFLPQKVMKFDWNGNLLNPTKANIKATAKWLDGLRVRSNKMAKVNRAANKAVERFYFCRDEDILDKWDAKDALLFRNAQLRQQAIEAVGLERVIGHLKQRVLNTDTIDGRYYELIQLDIPNQYFDTHRSQNKWNKKSIQATYLKMINPSTGEIHLEGIPLATNEGWDFCPKETVGCALAWRDGEVSGHSYDVGWKYTKPEILT